MKRIRWTSDEDFVWDAWFPRTPIRLQVHPAGATGGWDCRLFVAGKVVACGSTRPTIELAKREARVLLFQHFASLAPYLPRNESDTTP